MTWDWDYAIEILPNLLEGLGVTVEVTLIGSAAALLLGLLVAVPRYLKVPVLSQVLAFYVEFVRGTPLLVQAYLAFFVLPSIGLRFDALATGIIVMAINHSAYTAEAYRAGINSVPRGQWEAAIALSLPPWRTWTRIVLPQALRPVVPALGNYLVSMFKDTAILSAITVEEVMSRALQAGSNTYRYLEPLTMAGILFLVISYPASLLVNRLEKSLAL